MALRSVLKSSQSIYFEETTILSALRSLKLESSDTDFLLGLIGEQPGKKLINIKIELYKNQQAYVEALKCFMQSDLQQHRVFEWITHLMESLRDEPDQTAFNKFKSAVRSNFYTLVCIDARTGSSDCQQSLDLFFAYFNDPDFLYRLVITEMVVDP